MYYYDPRQWSFVTDMNFSGSITISDMWLWVKWLFYYPGDSLVYFLVKKVPKVGQFLEITYNSYGGIFSEFVSMIVWGIAFVTACVILEAILPDACKKILGNSNENQRHI